jgi:hypothetical protein
MTKKPQNELGILIRPLKIAKKMLKNKNDMPTQAKANSLAYQTVSAYLS